MRVPMDNAFYGLAPSREDAQALDQRAAKPSPIAESYARQAELQAEKEETVSQKLDAGVSKHSHKHGNGKRGRK